MTKTIQQKIDRTIGLANVDLSSITDLDDIIPHIASSCPACTAADLSENVGTAIARVEEALARLKALKADLDAKTPDALVLVSYMDSLEESFLFKEGECGSSLGWLLRTAIDEHKAGNTQAVPRFIAAHDQLHEVYVSDAGNAFDYPYNTQSDTFDAYTEQAVRFVKGASATMPSYGAFIQAHENSVAH